MALHSLQDVREFNRVKYITARRERGNAVAQWLAPAFQNYFTAQVAAGRAMASVTDVAAAMIALDASLGECRNGLVRVVADSRLALGQTVTGFEPAQRTPLAVSPEGLSQMVARAST